MGESSPTRKILIIEDDWDFQALMSVFLCENGFEVESADNGRAGIKKALCSRPDLILMDYDLGDMQGHEAAFWLENMKGTRNIPVVLLSGLAGAPEIASLIKKHAICKAILSKTQPPDEILQSIKTLLSWR